MEAAFANLLASADAVAVYLASSAFAHDVYAVLAANWTALQVTIVVVALVILVSSADDLLVDVAFWAIMIGDFLFGRPGNVPMSKVRKKPERWAAIMVPAWREAGVIGHMVANTAATTGYTNFHIFVGTYPNDPETRRVLDEIKKTVPNLNVVVNPRPGPTSKADCLNAVLEEIFAFEKRNALQFGMFMLHDAEDVVHAFGLKAANWFIDGYGMIQLPVLSVDRNPWAFVACHYMDEFAEWHTKDLVVRSRLTKMTPSAGVATAFSREAIVALWKDRDGQPFNVESLTEDYDIAHRLRELGFPSRFVRYWAWVPSSRLPWLAGRRELVATKELFPDTVRASYRQKARWTLGISYFGWRHLRWSGTLLNRYFLWRDRKALITAPVAMLGYLLVLEYLAYAGLRLFLPELANLPPLVEQAWVWRIIEINLLFLAIRLAHRALFTGYAHGLNYVWLSPLRAVVANYIAFLAFLRALRIFLKHALTGRAIKWDKTKHSYPAFAQVAALNGNGGGQAYAKAA